MQRISPTRKNEKYRRTAVRRYFCSAAERINEKRPEVLDFRAFKLELLSRFELETSSLPRMRSTN